MRGRADAGAGGCGEADEHQWAGRGASVGVEAKNEHHEHQQRWAEGKADQQRRAESPAESKAGASWASAAARRGHHEHQ